MARGTNPGIKIPGFGESSVAVRTAMQEIVTKLGIRSFPTFAGIGLSGLTASRLVASDASKQLVSTNLNSWVAGTANEIDITDDGDGTITIGLVDPLIVGKGGTGAVTLTDHGILLGSGTGAITPLGAATNGQLPIGSTGADPVLASLTGTANQIAVTNGAGTITLSLTGNMDELAALATTDGNFIVGNGTTWVAESGATARTSIGLGTGDSPTFAGLTLSGNIVLPNDGWIGSVGDTTAIQINATGGVNMPGDLTITGHVIFDTDNSHIGYTDNSPMAVFNNADDRIEITGGLTVSGATTGVGTIATTGGELQSGVADTTRGYCRLFGQGTGNVWGGTLYLETSADHDTTIDAYILGAYEDDFTLQNGVSEVFKIAGADNAATFAGTVTSTGLVVNAATALAQTLTIADSDLYSAWYVYSATATHAPLLALAHYRGTVGSPTITQDGDELGGFTFQGYNNGGKNAAEIRGYADGEWGTAGDTTDNPGRIVFNTASDGGLSPTERMRISNNGYVSIGTLATANEMLEVSGKIRADTAFNLNGTDGVSQAASAGTVCDVTALAGGIATAQTQITYATDGTYNFDATSGKVSSITITNGRITAITTVP